MLNIGAYLFAYVLIFNIIRISVSVKGDEQKFCPPHVERVVRGLDRAQLLDILLTDSQAGSGELAENIEGSSLIVSQDELA